MLIFIIWMFIRIQIASKQLLNALAEREPARWGLYRFYLERHIEHDDERHGPICRKLVSSLCGEDPQKWAEASATARAALEARIVLWDAVAAEFEFSPRD